MTSRPSPTQLLGILLLASFTVFITWKAKSLDKRLHQGSDASSMVKGRKRKVSGLLLVEPGDVRAKQHIGFVLENFAFYKHLNAEKLLRFHLALSGVNFFDSIL